MTEYIEANSYYVQKSYGSWNIGALYYATSWEQKIPSYFFYLKKNKKKLGKISIPKSSSVLWLVNKYKNVRGFLEAAI